MRLPLSEVAAPIVVPALARFLNMHAEADAPIPPGPLFRPYIDGKRYTFAHYNVVIPDLPAPHRFLACAVLVGRTGTPAFDIDHVLETSPRNTATLAVGTAATAPNWFNSYSIADDCDLRPDGSLMRFGNDLQIAGDFPNYAIRIRRPGFELDIEATCTEQITWFIRNPIYDHIGFPARYHGTLTWNGNSQPIEGVLSLEHARLLSPTAVADRPIPSALKIPIDFFTYHVIKLEPDTLLMLAGAGALGRPLLTSAYIKQIDGAESRHVRNVTFEVLSYRDDPQTAPDGSTMRVPHELRWRIHKDGRVTTEINATADTDLIYGLGRGWIGGYTYQGHHNAQPINGTGYYEYVDRRRNF